MSRTSKALQEIKSMPKQYNFLKGVGKGLTINESEILKFLKPYEVEFSKETEKYIDENWEDITSNHDNSYNWGSPVVMEICTLKLNSRKYIAIAYHLYGDVRGNYTDFVFYDFNSFEEFWEIMSDFRKGFSFTRGHYEIMVDCCSIFMESGYVDISWSSHLKGDGAGDICEVYCDCDMSEISEIKDFAYDKVKEEIYKQTMRG